MRRYTVRMAVEFDSWAKGPKDAERRARKALKRAVAWDDGPQAMGAEVVASELSQVDDAGEG